MRISNFTGFINERYLNWVSKDITIKIDVETSRHANYRKFRHADERIYDDEIVDTVERAIEPLTQALVSGELNINTAFVLKDMNSELHIVCNLFPTKEPFNFKLVVITMMRKAEFTYGKDQFFLEI